VLPSRYYTPRLAERRRTQPQGSTTPSWGKELGTGLIKGESSPDLLVLTARLRDSNFKQNI
jgi:hypothetical protein